MHISDIQAPLDKKFKRHLFLKQRRIVENQAMLQDKETKAEVAARKKRKDSRTKQLQNLIARKVKVLIQPKGVVEVVAATADVRKQAVYRWAKDGKMSLLNLIELSKATHVPIDEIVGLKSADQSDIDGAAQVSLHWQKLSREAQIMILKVLAVDLADSIDRRDDEDGEPPKDIPDRRQAIVLHLPHRDGQ